MTVCRHPKERRSLLSDYDVVCDECGQIIGRVALFPCAVLTARESAAIIAGWPDRLLNHAEQDAFHKLGQAAG